MKPVKCKDRFVFFIWKKTPTPLRRVAAKMLNVLKMGVLSLKACHQLAYFSCIKVHHMLSGFFDFFLIIKTNDDFFYAMQHHSLCQTGNRKYYITGKDI